MKITKDEVIQELSDLVEYMKTTDEDIETFKKAIYLLGWLEDEVFEIEIL